MGARARGLLLFGFAFSSVLSLPEIAAPRSSASAGVATNSSSSSSKCVDCAGRSIEKRDAGWDGGIEDEPEKRSRIGFTGMRGKKSADEESGLAELLDKRTRMGFNGMRGKKWPQAERRGPAAFHGMRGKKDGDYYYYEDYPEAEADDDGLIGDWDKRTMAFHGMRGRRMDEAVLAKRGPLLYDDGGDYLKRAMGFLGMRGKKLDDKRAPQSAFFGMKGKKAQSGFFGMRGKKSSPIFFGMGEPLDNEFNTISSLSRGHSSSDRVRRGTNWLRNSKKAKSAFFAVRGKKATALDDDDDHDDGGSEMSFISASE